jgi:hypothetical protein
MAGCEDNGGIIVEVNVLLAKFLNGNAFYLDERSEDDFDTKIFGNGVIQRLIAGGLGLRN